MKRILFAILIFVRMEPLPAMAVIAPDDDALRWVLDSDQPFLLYMADYAYGRYPESNGGSATNPISRAFIEPVLASDYIPIAEDTNQLVSWRNYFSEYRQNYIAGGLDGPRSLADGPGPSGFYAIVARSVPLPSGKCNLIAFRGSLAPNPFDSEARGNWRENFLQAIISCFASGSFETSSSYERMVAPPDDMISRRLPIYDAARNLAIKVKLKHPGRLLLVGHSLGGGLATFASGYVLSRWPDADARTYNTARLGARLNAETRASIGKPSRVQNFRLDRDIVSQIPINDGNVGMDVVLRGVAFGRSGFGELVDAVIGGVDTYHSMAAVFSSFAAAKQTGNPINTPLESAAAALPAILFGFMVIVVLAKVFFGLGWKATCLGLLALVFIAVFVPSLLAPLGTLAIMVIAFRVLTGMLGRSRAR